MTAPPIPRRHDLDWLRVFAVLAVFFYHLARFFDPAWWHIKNAQAYPIAGLFRLLIGAWMMPLIFLVSGAAAFYALQTRTPQAFIRDRAARLLVPFAAGVLTHVAFQVYLERRFWGQFTGGFPAFYRTYFEGPYGWGGDFAWMGLHLWFLAALFLYSVLLLPLFLGLKRSRSHPERVYRASRSAADHQPKGLAFGISGQQVDRTDSSAPNPGQRISPGDLAPFTLALPIMLLLAVLDPAALPGNRDAGGWSLLIYPLFMLYGFTFAAHPPLEESIRRARWASLAAALLSSAAVIFLWQRRSGPAQPLDSALYGLNAWCWLLVLWGFGTLHLNAPSPLLRYANDAILPFYILHQSVMLAAGYAIIRQPIPDALKALLIAALTFALTLALYHVFIRPFNPVRVLFGLRPR